MPRRKGPVAKLPPASVFRRSSKHKGRVIRRSIARRKASDALGELSPGCELFGLTMGQFSLIDIIEHCLTTTGPADVDLSTWTVAGSDIGFALGLVSNGLIRSIRFVVDFSFPYRQPAFCAALRERFGDDSIRLTRVHAKLCTIVNEDWALVIRGSMNLNENRRIEVFEISDDRAMANHVRWMFAEVFAAFDGRRQFEDFSSEVEWAQYQELNARLADGSYFGDGPLATDMRRAGWSTDKGARLTDMEIDRGDWRKGK